MDYFCAGALEKMLIRYTEIEMGTVILGADMFVEFEVGERRNILWIMQHCISELLYDIAYCPEAGDESSLETVSQLSMIAMMEVDVVLCHKVTLAVCNTALEKNPHSMLV